MEDPEYRDRKLVQDRRKSATYRAEHLTAIKEYGVSYRAKNKESQKERNATYKAANKDAIKEQRAAYRKRNAASINVKARMDFLGRVTPVSRMILAVASFQPTDECRRTFALWLLDNPDPTIEDAVKTYKVDNFLADYSGI
jgi:hypothetical protein